MASRGMLALGGGYTGARVDKASLSRYNPMAGSPTSDIIRDLRTLRSRSRDQMRNAPSHWAPWRPRSATSSEPGCRSRPPSTPRTWA
jgi:hypothetical protein